VHAGTTIAQDFVPVSEVFYRIHGAIEEIELYRAGRGLIPQLLAKMTELDILVQHWSSFVDREKPNKDAVEVPGRGTDP
jgi:hypothetical protein